jgi:ParB/RepB/Spo0J family partition protein
MTADKITLLPFSSLVITKDWNIRLSLPNIESLARSIASQGLKIPFRVIKDKSGKFALRDGHRRHAAVSYAIKHLDAPITKVPVIVLDNVSEQQLLLDALTCNSGEPMDLLERGRGYLRLLETGLTVGDIAARTGLGHSSVSKGIVLAKAPPELHRVVRDGKLSATQAYELVSKFSHDELLHHVNALVASTPTDKKLSRKDVSKTLGADPRSSKAKFFQHESSGSASNDATDADASPKNASPLAPVANPSQKNGAAHLLPTPVTPAPVVRRAFKTPNLIDDIATDDQMVSLHILKHSLDVRKCVTAEAANRMTTYLIIGLFAANKIEDADVKEWIYNGVVTPHAAGFLNFV